MATTQNMPRYLSHKIVRALKIFLVQLTKEGGAHLQFDRRQDIDYPPTYVSPEFITKHRPLAGGYFVVYEDGYQSFSPAQAFEDGYTLCDPS